MKKISLKNAENVLSRKEMRSISGGYSRLYCFIHSFDVIIQGIITHHGLDYDDCRKGLVSH
jgi:natural product precursor